MSVQEQSIILHCPHAGSRVFAPSLAAGFPSNCKSRYRAGSCVFYEKSRVVEENYTKQEMRYPHSMHEGNTRITNSIGLSNLNPSKIRQDPRRSLRMSIFRRAQHESSVEASPQVQLGDLACKNRCDFTQFLIGLQDPGVLAYTAFHARRRIDPARSIIMEGDPSLSRSGRALRVREATRLRHRSRSFYRTRENPHRPALVTPTGGTSLSEPWIGLPKDSM
ncbi:hypothetical protein BC834DRAFT_886614 [Gloeopeniophorella convolvens]|nr:hypothetical protein BC834DRAFT_886614 [Gloeopeniophorella convolvens]